MGISHHLDTFAGLPVVPFEPGATGRGRKKRAACAYRLGGLEFGKEKHSLAELLDLYLETPGAAETTALVIGAWDYEDMLEWGAGNAEIVQALAAARDRLPKLRALFLGDITYEECEISWLHQGDVAPLLAAYPGLEEFRVRGAGGLSFGKKFRHDGLRTLAIESGGLGADVLKQLWKAELPNLEHLELWLGTSEYGGIDTTTPLKPLLSGNLFPNLHYLGLCNSAIADTVAKAIAKAPLLERLRVLDLSLGNLSDEGARALLASPAVRKLEKLDIHHHYVSPEMVSDLLQLGIVVNAGDVQKSRADDFEDRYNAHSE